MWTGKIPIPPNLVWIHQCLQMNCCLITTASTYRWKIVFQAHMRSLSMQTKPGTRTDDPCVSPSPALPRPKSRKPVSWTEYSITILTSHPDPGSESTLWGISFCNVYIKGESGFLIITTLPEATYMLLKPHLRKILWKERNDIKTTTTKKKSLPEKKLGLATAGMVQFITSLRSVQPGLQWKSSWKTWNKF